MSIDWRATLKAFAEDTSTLYGPLTQEDLQNGVVQAGNYVTPRIDLQYEGQTIFKEGESYQVASVHPEKGKGGFIINQNGIQYGIYFEEEGEESGWAEYFFKVTPQHPTLQTPQTFAIPGGPNDLPEDILDLLNVRLKGVPTSIDKVVQEEVATFRPSSPGDVKVFKTAIANALIYLQNIGKIVVDLEERAIYLTKAGSR